MDCLIECMQCTVSKLRVHDRVHTLIIGISVISLVYSCLYAEIKNISTKVCDSEVIESYYIMSCVVVESEFLPGSM